MSASLRLATLCLIAVCTASAQYYGGQGLGILPGTAGYGGFGHPGFGRSSLNFPHDSQLSVYGGGSGSRFGQGYTGNGGIGIKQTDANLADLYGLPRQLAQAPPPRPLQVPQAPLNPYLSQQYGQPGPYGQFPGPYGQPASPYGQPVGPYGPGLLNGAHYGGRYLG